MNNASQQTRASIWRYELENDCVIELPAGAKLLSVGFDNRRIIATLYVLVDPQVPKVKRRVKLLSTGHELVGDGWEFAGTVQAPLNLVYHAFIEIV